MLSLITIFLKIFAGFLLFFGFFGFGSEISKLFSGETNEGSISGLSLAIVIIHSAYKIFSYNVTAYRSSFRNTGIVTFAYLLFYFGFFAIFNSIDNSIYKPEKYDGFIDWFLSFSLMGLGGFLLYQNRKAPIERTFESVMERAETYQAVKEGTDIQAPVILKTTDAYGSSAAICQGCNARNPSGTKVCIYCGGYI